MYKGRGSSEEPNIFRKNSFFVRPAYVEIKYSYAFVFVQLAIVSLLIIIGLFAYLYNNELPFEDPMIKVKKDFLNAQRILFILTAAFTLFVLFKVRDKKSNKNCLTLLIIVSLIILFIFIGVKSYLDTKYNTKVYENYYDEFYDKSKVDKGFDKNIYLGLNGISIMDSKEMYVTELENDYKVFGGKIIVNYLLQTGIIVVCLFMLIKANKKENVEDILSKDDKILFDDETNIKY